MLERCGRARARPGWGKEQRVLHGFGTTAAGHLEMGGCDALDLARAFGTPLHVLDEGQMRASLRAYREALAAHYPAPSRPVFASKALCVVATCQVAHQEGFGIDVVSMGEIHTARLAGVPAADMIFHGSNKTPEELRYALREGVGRIVVDNFYELELLDEITREMECDAEVLLRLTPGIEPHTHKAIITGGVDSKFGFGILGGDAEQAVRRALELPRVRLRGLHSHIGSQILEVEPFVLAAEAMMDFAGRMKEQAGLTLAELNLGGGLGIRYTEEHQPPEVATLVHALGEIVVARARRYGIALPTLMLEPGRSIVGEAGVTLYTMGAVKAIPGVRTYVSVDGGMYENPRTALYDARYTAVVASRPNAPATQTVAIAGRCCESGDVLIWEASLPAVKPGEILAVFSTGAYNYSMAGNYNRYPRPAMVMVREGVPRVVVERETLDDLVRKDVPLPA
ncbi:MAG: diaminopimelate decarboxylase [Armatimonadetes bacterium]|nr:diaminopimelate decarboxylase [Armatimonadota bacterium]